MRIVVFLILGPAICGIVVTGQLEKSPNAFIDYGLFLSSDSLLKFKLYYEIPYQNLLFEIYKSPKIKELGGTDSFIGRYKISIQVWDMFSKSASPVVGEIVAKDVYLNSYEATKSDTLSVIDEVVISFPWSSLKQAKGQSKIKAEVVIVDLNSGRLLLEQDFIINEKFPLSISSFRFLKNNRLNPKRVYQTSDTLGIFWESYPDNEQFDSQAVLIRNLETKELFKPLAAHKQMSTVDTGFLTNRFGINSSVSELGLIPGTYEVIIRTPNEVSPRRGGYSEFRIPNSEFRITGQFFLLDKDYFSKIDELLYIATSEEIESLKNVPKEKRQKGWDDFWLKRDPSPNTPTNETKDEYYERIEYCKRNFSKGDRGYKSERAKIYMKYGPPDQIESRPFELYSNAYEIWYYYNLGLVFTFVDTSGFGEFILQSEKRGSR